MCWIFLENTLNVCIFYHFCGIRIDHDKMLQVEIARSQGINSHGVGIFLLEYSDLKTSD